MEGFNTKLAGTVRHIRSKRGLTQAQAAKNSGLSTSYWALIEQGRRSPNLATLSKIASALGVPISILLFLSTDTSELESVDKALAERLALVSWKVIEQGRGEKKK